MQFLIKYFVFNGFWQYRQAKIFHIFLGYWCLFNELLSEVCITVAVAHFAILIAEKKFPLLSIMSRKSKTWLISTDSIFSENATHCLIITTFILRRWSYWSLQNVGVGWLIFTAINWRCGVVVIPTAQLHSTKPELRFCARSEIRDDEDLWQWSQLKIRLNAFRRSTIPQKQFIIIIMIIIMIMRLKTIFLDMSQVLVL